MDTPAPDDLRFVACLSLSEQDDHLATEAIAGLVTNSLTCAGIVVCGDRLAAFDRQALAAAAGDVAVVLVPAGAGLDAAVTAARTSGAGFVALLSPEAILPYGWDVRLARIAQDDSTVGSVSPLGDRSAAHCLSPSPEVVDDPARLDRLAYLLGPRGVHPVPTPMPDCCMVPLRAIEGLRASQDGQPRDVRTLGPALAASGLLHVLTDATYVGSRAVSSVVPLDRSRAAQRLPVDTGNRLMAAYRSGIDFRGIPGLDGRTVQLHVIHDLGGGCAKWLFDYSTMDHERVNLVLKSVTWADGSGIAIYSHALDPAPMRVWQFADAIQGATTAHLEYRRALAEILADYCVDVILISSLIGHSLDILDTRLPTAVVTHDYFPYCPAINIHFEGVCRHCDDRRIEDCYAHNPDFNPFVDFLPAQRTAVRRRFLDLLEGRRTVMIAPSRSVRDHLVTLEARFAGLSWQMIPHAIQPPVVPAVPLNPPPEGRLRLLVLGQLSAIKGIDLLRQSLDAILGMADVFLIGSGEMGDEFKYRPGILVVSRYDPEELPRLVADINPHLALLTSICPETFSYALSELALLGVPVAATRVGSFAERLIHGENGFLYDPNPESLLALLRSIDGDRGCLAPIRARLPSLNAIEPEAMIGGYHAALPVPSRPAARYPVGRIDGGAWNAGRDPVLVSQTTTLAAMWKEMKSLHLRLSTSNDARHRAEIGLQTASEDRRRLHDLLAEKTATSTDQVHRIDALTAQLAQRDAQLAEVYASTSWRWSAPIRWVGRRARQLRAISRLMGAALREPRSLPAKATKAYRLWRSGGLPALRQVLTRTERAGGLQDLWHDYRRRFDQEVRPQIVRDIRQMVRRPLISIIVPTYNTPAAMLDEMIASVLAQLYPNWELCIADDGSSQPHVARMLQARAAADQRIKLDLGRENRGVSHASNRALALATGDFTVLLDHDDVLEEQALFRVAESLLADDPDLLYSDEVLVSENAREIKQVVCRPAFSPEFLRGHPYIVHLVGFRTQLLREVGGFDESLRISQDYDLILRVSERARTIVHVPEVLYRWRIHGSSAGHQKMHQVMATSREILERHLGRCGDHGHVDDGAGFNFFDARYPLAPDLRVAIIIPTKNHGDLVRQCIDSLHATVTGVAYDVVVIDHQSDDQATLAYLSSIADRARVLRYEGPFNFSAINNWAVGQLAGSYSHYLFCNNDIEALATGWLERMLELCQRPSIGIVGAKLFYPDRRTIQHGGVVIGAFGRAEHSAKFLRLPDDRLEPGYFGALVINHEVAAVTAACLLIRRNVFEEVSGFDEAIAVGFGDVDLCLRVGQLGYRVVFCPYAELVHHESYTRGTSPVDTHPGDTALYLKKWRSLLEAGDPYYSPGLSLESTTWDLRVPQPCHRKVGRRIATVDRDSGRLQVSFGGDGAP